MRVVPSCPIHRICVAAPPSAPSLQPALVRPIRRHPHTYTMATTAPLGDADTPLDLYAARDLVAHRGQVHSVAWSSNGRRLASGSSDGTVKGERRRLVGGSGSDW